MTYVAKQVVGSSIEATYAAVASSTVVEFENLCLSEDGMLALPVDAVEWWLCYWDPRRE